MVMKDCNRRGHMKRRRLCLACAFCMSNPVSYRPPAVAAIIAPNGGWLVSPLMASTATSTMSAPAHGQTLQTSSCGALPRTTHKGYSKAL